MVRSYNFEDLRKREFSLMGELLVAKELEKRGWEVFRPLVDRYIDIVAVKEENGKVKVRTIQVKSSRIEHFVCSAKLKGERKFRKVEVERIEDNSVITKQKTKIEVEEIICAAESYGFTHKPKDLIHDPRHFFVWVLIDQYHNKPYFFVLSVSDFINLRWKDKPTKKYEKVLKREDGKWNLLMRYEWRWGTDRIHPQHWINKNTTPYKNLLEKLRKRGKLTGRDSVDLLQWFSDNPTPTKLTDKDDAPEWTLDKEPIDKFLENWDWLEDIDESRSNAELIIDAQEINDEWIGNTKEVIEKWRKNKEKANKIILSKNPELSGHIKRLDEFLLEEEDLDPPPSKTSIERTIEILLKTSKKDEWEGYISTKEPRKALLLRFVCSKCGTPWNIERKECYFCKTPYYRVKVCEKCGWIDVENVAKCRKCGRKNTMVKNV